MNHKSDVIQGLCAQQYILLEQSDEEVKKPYMCVYYSLVRDLTTGGLRVAVARDIVSVIRYCNDRITKAIH